MVDGVPTVIRYMLPPDRDKSYELFKALYGDYIIEQCKLHQSTKQCIPCRTLLCEHQPYECRYFKQADFGICSNVFFCCNFRYPV